MGKKKDQAEQKTSLIYEIKLYKYQFVTSLIIYKKYETINELSMKI